MDSITIVVPGDPVPQPRARMTRTGHVYTPDRNGIGAYRRAIALLATAKAREAGWRTSDGPHVVEIDAVFGRPKSHMTSRGELRSSVPAFPRADVDNVEKAVLDSVTASCAVWEDDRQVVRSTTAKRYIEPGEQPRTVVVVRRVAVARVA
jgi:Holliday junction resolvase RusA-like endonuclease